MTDKPTPKEIDDLVYELRQAGKDDTYSLASAVLAKWGQPSGATEEVENLRKALVYAAFASHDTPQYMLAQGITLIDGDTVRVSRDGWTVEASVNPHRQPAPATQQAREVSDAMVLAALQVQHPAAYGQYLRHPANGPKTSIRTEAEIDTARRMIAAALAAAPQPVARELLTPEQIQDLLLCGDPTDDETRLIRIGWDAARGIKGGQHGTE